MSKEEANAIEVTIPTANISPEEISIRISYYSFEQYDPREICHCFFSGQYDFKRGLIVYLDGLATISSDNTIFEECSIMFSDDFMPREPLAVFQTIQAP